MKTKSIFAWGIMLSACILATSCKKSENAPAGSDQGAVSASKNSLAVKSVSSTTTIWGASSAAFPGESLSGIASWQRLNRRIMAKNGNVPLTFRRSYDSGIPANFNASAMADDIGNCAVSVGEIKPDWVTTASGSNFNQIKQYVQTFPAGRTIYLVFFHEPEDNVNATHTIDDLQHAFAQFVGAVIAAGNPNVHPCYVLMSWTFNPASGRNPDDYNMGKYLTTAQKSEVIAGMDGYADDPTKSASTVFNAPFNKMGTWGFSRFGIFETGVHTNTNPASRANWIAGLGTFVAGRSDMELVSYFNSGVGAHAGPTGWYLGNWYLNSGVFTWDDADGSLNAYADLF